MNHNIMNTQVTKVPPQNPVAMFKEVLLQFLFTHSPVMTSDTVQTLPFEITSKSVFEEVLPKRSQIKHVDGINYHIYGFIETEEKCTYVLQRKIGNGMWENYDTRNGFASPNGIILSYCFKDTVSDPGIMSYRILKAYERKKMVINSNAKMVNKGMKVWGKDVTTSVDGRTMRVCLQDRFQSVHLYIFDLNGEQVDHVKLTNTDEFIYNADKLGAGQYYYVVEADSSSCCPGLVAFN